MSILLAQSETSLFFWVQLKGHLSRAPVDWEQASLFSNVVPFTLRSRLRSSSSSCCLVSSSSLAFQALAFSAQTVPVAVASWFRTRYRTSSSLPLAFALLKMFPKHSPYLGRLLLLHFALSEQLDCPLGSCCSILHCLSNWVVRWVAVIALAVVHCLNCVALLCICCLPLLIYASQ